MSEHEDDDWSEPMVTTSSADIEIGERLREMDERRFQYIAEQECEDDCGAKIGDLIQDPLGKVRAQINAHTWYCLKCVNKRYQDYQLVIQELAEALRGTGCYLKTEKQHCWCGGGGSLYIPHQDYCLKARSALAAAKQFLEKKK